MFLQPLARRHDFARCSITVVDRSDPSQPDAFPSPDAASVDTSRIVRADYADPAYAALADEAQAEWRKQDTPASLGAQGRYNETGLLLVGDATPPEPAAADAPAGEGSKPKLTGLDYVRMSWANVSSLAAKSPELAARVQELPDPDAIRAALGTGGSSGSWGYINKNSGWADATASMAWLLNQVQQTKRVDFVAGTVVSLEHGETTVTGAKLSDGRVLSADLVIVAAGAWTGGLVDLGGQAVATGQVLGYIDITEAEQEKLANMPVVLNLSTGLFIIPPTDRVLKIARHAYGYINPVTLPHPPLPLFPTHPPPPNPTVSLPRTSLTDSNLSIPAEGAADLRRALRDMIPWPALCSRPFRRTRLCWYSDTATGDFLIDYHPGWRGLFVATGDSGHAFKFLPVIGDKIADCIAGACPPEFRAKWAWKAASASASAAGSGSGSDSLAWSTVVTEDGSRGGTPGLVLADELAKSPKEVPAHD
ncbi:3fb70c73-00d1-4c8c-ba01-ca1034557014 [Thermothielavioides terrestris]|uniref:3fb70c73-00d1-4c8c-ba01-ca1034557014 n=1 Tax=Thermothielavioides terrestris TaxID=2587410 RepID=A0A3S4BR25_9PEZI|nr:3fb70c73-00d1-4c8c-ba01-ca1034557014 [Thermothielavioides terrestris]